MDDINFLREMLERLEKAPDDKTEYEYLKKMMEDWLEELKSESPEFQ